MHVNLFSIYLPGEKQLRNFKMYVSLWFDPCSSTDLKIRNISDMLDLNFQAHNIEMKIHYLCIE